MSTTDDYLGRVLAIVWAASDYVSADGLREVQRLVEHGESAEGMRSLAWLIVDERRRVPRRLIADIREHAAGLVDDESMPPTLDDFGTDNPRGK